MYLWDPDTLLTNSLHPDITLAACAFFIGCSDLKKKKMIFAVPYGNIIVEYRFCQTL